MNSGIVPARKSGLFLDPEHCTDAQVSARNRGGKVPHGRRRGKGECGLVDAVIDGERVLLATAPEPLEKGIQIRIVTALSAAGVRVLQHRIFPCVACGRIPPTHAGLGRYAADVLCIVPPYGRACFIEIKRPRNRNAKRDANQREWAKWIRRYGGVAGTATNEEEALVLVEFARGLP